MTKRRKIWIFNHYASTHYIDKAGRHYWISKYLKQFGYDPVVFCCNKLHNSDGFYFKNERVMNECMDEATGVHFVFIQGRDYTGNGKDRVLNMIDFYRNLKKVAKYYGQENGRPDIIYASSVHPLTLVAGIQLSKTFNVKCICEIRDLWPESIVGAGIATKRNLLIKVLYGLEKWIYKSADRLVFTMEGAYQYIVEQGWERDIPIDKVRYINNGIDLESFYYNKNTYKIDDDDLNKSDTFKVVYAGAIRKNNDVGKILDAAKLVEDSRVRFLIWGHGDDEEFLRQRVSEEGISNAKIKGAVPKYNIPYVLSRCDLGIIHVGNRRIAKYGLSLNKMYDYLAAGLPVLVDCSTEYNPAMQNGVGDIIPESDPGMLAKKIDCFAGMSAEELGRYKKNALEAAKMYDFEKHTKKLIELIEDV